MGRFKKILSFKPGDIHSMSMRQKRECMNEINRRRDKAVKFSAFYSIAVFIFAGIKSLYNFIFLLRDETVLENISPLLLLFAVVLMAVSFFACMLKRALITTTMVFYAAFAVYLILSGGVSIILAPFSLFGTAVYFWLLGVYDADVTLKNEPGYPDFLELSKDMLQKEKDSIHITDNRENEQIKDE